MIGLGVDHIGSVILSREHCQDPVLKATVEKVQAAGCKSSLIPLFRRQVDHYGSHSLLSDPISSISATS